MLFSYLYVFSIYVYFYLSIYLSIYRSIYLSIFLSRCHCPCCLYLGWHMHKLLDSNHHYDSKVTSFSDFQYCPLLFDFYQMLGMWIKQYQTYSMGIAPDESGTTCSKNSEPRLYSATPYRAGILAGTFAGRRQAFLGGPWEPGTVGCGASKCAKDFYGWGFWVWANDILTISGQTWWAHWGEGLWSYLPGVRCEQCYER